MQVGGEDYFLEEKFGFLQRRKINDVVSIA
jgi:hypothetical protein